MDIILVTTVIASLFVVIGIASNVGGIISRHRSVGNASDSYT